MGVLLVPSSPGSLERKQLGQGCLLQPQRVPLAVADAPISRLQRALGFCSHTEVFLQGPAAQLASAAGQLQARGESQHWAALVQLRNMLLPYQERHLAF